MEAVENVVDYLANNPVYVGLGVVLLALIVGALIKKMTKLLIFALVLTAAYGYYLHDAARDPLDAVTDSLKGIGADTERLMERHGVR